MIWLRKTFPRSATIMIGLFVLINASTVHAQLLKPPTNSATHQNMTTDFTRPFVFFAKNAKGQIRYLSNLQGVNYRGGTFDGANFTGANLQDALFQGATFHKANLYLANLQDAKLSRARMQKANLTAANLQGADLEEADLEEANLFLTNFNHANLFGANFKETFVAGANFHKANLRGADLSEVVGLTQEQIDLACVDDSTLIPPHLVRPEPCPDYSWK